MKTHRLLLAASFLLAAAVVSPAFADLPKGPPAKIDFSWRTHAGDFPQDKPGYLILTTEDAVRWSKVLPEFVKQKEAMGFRVYLATEKDYGTGKKGNAQAAQVRAWMREFHKRAALKYALLIGNSSPGSADLPSPTVPDGERGGWEPAYADLDGAWIDLYLNATREEARALPYNYYGSQLALRALKTSGGRRDEVIVGRIAYVGNEIGNGAYDLDRILDKLIRYERETVAGKRLDWRANALSVISNYGDATWDAPLLKAAESEGATFEQRSTDGWLGKTVPPENVVDRRGLNSELLAQTRRRGLVATMSHGWQRGGSGILSLAEFFRDIDSRWPSAVSVAACSAFALGDNCNTGQIWLRTGGIFAIGTSSSRNNGMRIPFHTRLLKDRVSVGEAGGNQEVQYGDPSLHVLPPKGTPLRALQISPALTGHHEERTLYPDTPVAPLTRAYTLTNNSAEPIGLTAETNAAWLTLSPPSLTLKPGESASVTAASNSRADSLTPGHHVADIRFRRADGQVDGRRLSLALHPLAITACYTFDAVELGKQFPDMAVEPGKARDARSLPLTRKKPAEPGKKNAGVEPVPGFVADPKGRVGGALRLENPAKGWSRGGFGYARWRGIATSFWFKLDALPAAKKSAPILLAPFRVSVDSAGLVTFAGNGKPAALDAIKPGEWHFVQLRTDRTDGKVRASLDGRPEVPVEATGVVAEALALGAFTGGVDELKVWSGELTASLVASEFAASRRPMSLPALPAPAAGAPLVKEGELRAPKEIPSVLSLSDPGVKLDISGALAANGLTCTLRDAPEWLDFRNGVIALKPGVDFDRIDFGGYDLFLVLTAKSGPFAGCVGEHPLKVRVPVPNVGIRISRAVDNTLTIASAGGEKRPLAKGVIRYTTDGSPVTENSPAYDKPFKTEGDKVTARFFYLGEYPYAPVTMKSEFGISRELWKPLAVTGKGGKPGSLKTAGLALDGRDNTAWKNIGGTLPQFFAWDLGRPETLTALSVHAAISSADGRIKGYNLYASDDGKVWRKVKTGEFESSPNAQKLDFGTPCKTRYLKLEATTLHGGKDMALVELEAFAK